VTDNGNYILDWTPPSALDPSAEDELKLMPGVVETGIFAKRRDAVVLVAREDGKIYTL
jgi:ribose 5-phosphate isomerase A